MSINETVLEMHFHDQLLNLFRETLGLGKGYFNFYKYSTRKECFVGFDQAFVQTEKTDEELLEELKNSSMNNNYNFQDFILGYFLQYKVVKKMKNRNRFTPKQINLTPHYRVKLDTKKNATTGFSQHELLYKLNKNYSAMVYYACPMIFEKIDLYKRNVDLDLLRLADVSDCPSNYSDNESHHIFFNDLKSIPIWCSEPVEGTLLSPMKLANHLKEKLTSKQFLEKQRNLLEMILEGKNKLLENGNEKLLSLVEDSLVIIQFKANDKIN